MCAEQNKLRLLKAPAIIAKLAARPELITYRNVKEEERPPRGLQLPRKTRMDEHDLEWFSLSQEQIFQELASHSTRLHFGGERSGPHDWHRIQK